jgi:type VI secretion system protein ImpC
MSETQSGAQAEAASATETSLLDQIMEETRLRPADEGYDVARQGVSAFIAELLKPSNAGEKLNANAIDIMIADIDRKLSAQIDEVLHAEAFQEMESAWRGLKYLVDKTNFRENTKIEILNVSKEDMLNDFEDSPEVAKSGLYRHVYTEEYGQFGGQPIATIIGNYDFGPGAQDIKLLQYTASVAAMAHAPFIAAASAEMFGVDKFEDIANLKDLKSVFEGPKYSKWNGFRESEDSRYVGLTLPRFMLPDKSAQATLEATHVRETREARLLRVAAARRAGGGCMGRGNGAFHPERPREVRRRRGAERDQLRASAQDAPRDWPAQARIRGCRYGARPWGRAVAISGRP